MPEEEKTIMNRFYLLGASLLLCAPIWAQVSGVGGFGGSPLGQSGMDPNAASAMNVGFMPWLSVNGIYTHRLGVIGVNDKADRMTGTFSGGIGGSKLWRDGQMEAGYTGSGNYNNSYGLGSYNPKWRQTHVGNFSFAKDLTQRWQVGLGAMAGLSDGGYGVGSAFGSTGVPGLGGGFGFGASPGSSLGGDGSLSDPSQNGLVDSEVLNARVKFSSTRGAVAYRLTERFSVNGSGSASFARRDRNLSGLNSFSGGGGFNYQLTQRTQIGATYTHSNLDYVGLFGGIRYDVAQFGFQKDVTQHLAVSMQAGGARLDSTFIGVTALPPDLAALLGVSGTLEQMKTRNFAVAGRFQLTYTGNNSSFTAGYNRGVVPGNGVLYTSVRDVALLGYGRKISQNFGINFIASYTRLSGKVAVMKVTETAQGGAMASYRLFKGISFTGQGGYRYTAISGVQQLRDVYAGVGLAWRPGDAVFVF